MAESTEHRASDLPFGSEFSPSQINLPLVLELADRHGGDFHAFEAAVYTAYFESYPTTEYNRRKLANNTKLGMIAYGLIDRQANLTEFGRHLYSIRHDEEQLYRDLARHILLNLHGMTLLQCVRDMQSAGGDVTLTELRRWLEERGIHFPRGGKHPSMMRLWLEKAGVVISGWRIDEKTVGEIMGESLEEIEALRLLTPEQRAFLKAIANVGDSAPHPSNEIEKLAAATYGVRFNEKSLPGQVLYPLSKAGFIALERGTKEPGRGAKPFMVVPTDKMQAEVILPLLKQIEAQVGAELFPFVRKPLAEILEEMNDTNTYIRGLALEALAVKLMRLIDLTYVATRLRGSETGGAEVDVIFEGTRLVFSRWQVQCKNTRWVRLDDVAKEVGLTHMLKSNVIIIVTTGEIGQEARRYANTVMADSNLCVVMINGDDIKAIEHNPVVIVDALHREARHAMMLKKLEI